jgi:DNA-binding transcriptional LysR family regulator
MEQSLLVLPDMALFVEVARTGSFRQAAARLQLPASTLSRRIAAMEARFGVSLFVRTTRSVALTPVARPYFERCVEVMDAAERAQAALAMSHTQQALMRIAMPVDLGVEFLGPVVADFLDAHPGLRVEFDLSSRAVDLLREPVDLAFRIGKPMDDRLVARKVADIASGLYAAPAWMQRAPQLTRAEQLEGVPCLDLRTALGSMAWRVGLCQWDSAPGPCVLAANSVSLLRKLAEGGRGVALLPHHMAAPSVQAGRLVRVLPDEGTPVWPVYAVTVGRQVPQRVRLLMAHVRSTLGEALSP